MKIKHLLSVVIVLVLVTIGVVTFFAYRGQDPSSSAAEIPRLLYVIEPIAEREELKEPTCAVTDNNGKVYVSDSGNRQIKVFTVNGKFRYAFNKAGKGNMLEYPSGIVILNNGNLLVADTKKRALYEFASGGRFVKEWAAARGKIMPGFMAIGPDENIYVSDLAGRQVVVFDKEGNVLRKLKPQNVTLDSPQGIALADRQTVIVGDNANYNVKILGPDGQLKSLFDGGPRFALTTVKGIARDAGGRIYVAETLANVIRVFDDRGNELMSFGQTGGRPGEFMFPTGISIDKKNRLYVVDQGNNRIQVYQIR